jgi:hypothetical protein
MPSQLSLAMCVMFGVNYLLGDYDVPNIIWGKAPYCTSQHDSGSKYEPESAGTPQEIHLGLSNQVPFTRPVSSLTCALSRSRSFASSAYQVVKTKFVGKCP